MIKRKRKLNKAWLIEEALLEGVIRNMAEARPVRPTTCCHTR